MQALTHDDWRIREQVADILRLIGSQDAVPALIKIAHDGALTGTVRGRAGIGAPGGPSGAGDGAVNEPGFPHAGASPGTQDDGCIWIGKERSVTAAVYRVRLAWRGARVCDEN